MAYRLDDLLVGKTVYVPISGVLTPFIIAHKGRPSDAYAWVDEFSVFMIAENILSTQVVFDATSDNYAESSLHTWLNETFYAMIDDSVRNKVKQFYLPYKAGSTGEIKEGYNGLEDTYCFCPSATELRLNGYDDGSSVFEYFNDSEAQDRRSVTGAAGITGYWTRTPRTTAGNATYIMTNGVAMEAPIASSTVGVRPMFILDGDTCVYEDNGKSIAREKWVSRIEIDGKEAFDANGLNLASSSQLLDGVTAIGRNGIAQKGNYLAGTVYWAGEPDIQFIEDDPEKYSGIIIRWIGDDTDTLKQYRLYEVGVNYDDNRTLHAVYSLLTPPGLIRDELTITANGTYNASDYDADGTSGKCEGIGKIIVNVPDNSEALTEIKTALAAI